MSTQILTQVLIIFLLAIVVNIVCSRFKLPVTVGFLLTGVLCGPSVLGFVSDMEVISSAADLGVAMLMFTIGMELSGEVLHRLKRPVFLGGSLQIGLIIAATACVGFFLHNLQAGILWGCLIALSSSAIVLHIFQQKGITATPVGRLTLAILVFQDMLVAPMMLLVPLLAGTMQVTLLSVTLAIVKVTALAAARLLLHKQYDAVHCADRAVRVGALLAWLFGVRLVFEWRTASGHDLTAWARARSKRSRRAVGLIITDHPCHPAGLRETGLLGRLAVIPPLPAPTIEPLSPPPARPKGASQLFRLTAFSLTPNLSDLTDFLEALPRLIERPNIRISIAGGSPAAAERLRKRCAETLPADAQPGIRPAIVSPAEFSTFVAPADLIFLPAANGPLPPPELLDAMAARRAILAVRCPAYEGLLNEANAMLIDSDARSLALGVLRHLRAHCLCVDHACAAAETIAAERSIANAVDNLRACYALALDQETP